VVNSYTVSRVNRGEQVDATIGLAEDACGLLLKWYVYQPASDPLDLEHGYRGFESEFAARMYAEGQKGLKFLGFGVLGRDMYGRKVFQLVEP
jgi:hypothetical protein